MAGFIKNNFDIKLILLYILSKIEEPVTFEELSYIAQCDENINYFLLKQSIQELLEPDNIVILENCYHITQRGRDNLSTYSGKLPLSIVQQCDISLDILKEEQEKRKANLLKEKYVKTELIPNPDTTYLVKLSFSDPHGTLMALNLIALNEKEAKTIAKSFYEEPSVFFHKIMGTVREFVGLE